MISSENAGTVTIEGKFLCAVCRKGVGSNSMLCLFCRYWMYERCSGILEVNGKRIASLNVRHLECSKQT